MVLFNTAPAHAATIVWDNSVSGSQDWTVGSNWIDGVAPTTDDDAQLGGATAPTTITNVSSVKSLTVNHGGSATISLDAGNSGTFATDSLSFSISNGVTGVVGLTATGSKVLDVSGAVTLAGGNTTANEAWIYLTQNSTLKASSISLSGTQTNRISSALSFFPSAASHVVTIDAPTVTFNNGSTQRDPNSWAGTVRFTGDVVMQAGETAGFRPQFGILRNTETMTGTIRVDGNLSQSVGILTLQGNGKISVGGDWNLAQGSSLFIVNDFDTRLQLGGDLNISATSLALDNFNKLSLDLVGSGVQALEVAVTDGDKTFRTNELTLDNTTFLLVDNHTNIDIGEYFQTMSLFNTGISTLDLNGFQFFVGDTNLTPGIYTDFGGTLNVIPEPSIWALTTLFMGFVLLSRFRRVRS